jgi:ribosomal protein S18 acetylase RimI-like enzyme
MIEVRVLTADDWSTWRDLRLAALAEAPYAFGSTLLDWQGDRDREERWRARLSIPGSGNFLALLDEKPAGMASGIPGPRRGVAELISLWVSAGARGQGVGDCLIRAVERWAMEQQAMSLQLSVKPSNEYAIALYRRHRFAEAGPPGGALPDGRGEHIMAKKLSPPLRRPG